MSDDATWPAITWARDKLVLADPCRAALLALATHLNSKTRQCNPSMKTLAGEIGVAESTAREYVRRLRELDLVTVNTARSKYGGNESNSYVLNVGHQPTAEKIAEVLGPKPKRETPVTKRNEAARVEKAERQREAKAYGEQCRRIQRELRQGRSQDAREGDGSDQALLSAGAATPHRQPVPLPPATGAPLTGTQRTPPPADSGEIQGERQGERQGEGQGKEQVALSAASPSNVTQRVPAVFAIGVEDRGLTGKVSATLTTREGSPAGLGGELAESGREKAEALAGSEEEKSREPGTGPWSDYGNRPGPDDPCWLSAATWPCNAKGRPLTAPPACEMEVLDRGRAVMRAWERTQPKTGRGPLDLITPKNLREFKARAAGAALR